MHARMFGAPSRRMRCRRGPVQRRPIVHGSRTCRGYGHIGFLKALEGHGLRPDLIVGSSIGSLIGALYAGGVSAQRLEQLGRRVSQNTLHDWVFPSLGLFGGDRIVQFVREHVAFRAIETLPIPFAAVATDLHSGARFIFDRADLAVEPKLPPHDDMTPATLAALVAAGRQAAIEAMPSLKRIFHEKLK
jgi:hypothetical protein